jgi:hypothetical protein
MLGPVSVKPSGFHMYLAISVVIAYPRQASDESPSRGTHASSSAAGSTWVAGKACAAWRIGEMESFPESMCTTWQWSCQLASCSTQIASAAGAMQLHLLSSTPGNMRRPHIASSHPPARGAEGFSLLVTIPRAPNPRTCRVMSMLL